MSSKVTHQLASARRFGAWAAAALLGTLLAACGGGQQVTQFIPTRVLAFGDESSVITATGSKYSVNALATDNVTLDCAAQPIWVQYLASSFGLVFPQCNPGAVSAPASRIFATAGAKSADVKTQIDLQLATDGFSGTDLVTVLAGANDILAQYQLYNGSNEAQLQATLEQAGTDLAAQVNRIALAGGKVLISTVPDMGLTPFAVLEAADPAKGADRAPLLTRLTERFNARLRLGIINDGRKIGLLLTDELFQTLVKFPSSYSFVNVTQSACTSATLLTCTGATLRPADTVNTTAATAFNYLWADNFQPTPAGHLRMGQLADARARGNPF